MTMILGQACSSFCTYACVVYAYAERWIDLGGVKDKEEALEG